MILGGVADVPPATAEPLREAACAGADHVLCDPAIEIRAASVATPEHGDALRPRAARGDARDLSDGGPYDRWS